MAKEKGRVRLWVPTAPPVRGQRRSSGRDQGMCVPQEVSTHLNRATRELLLAMLISWPCTLSTHLRKS